MKTIQLVKLTARQKHKESMAIMEDLKTLYVRKEIEKPEAKVKLLLEYRYPRFWLNDL